LSPEEKHRVSYHESGYSLVAELVPSGEPVHKVSIIPRGIGALGYMLQAMEKEKFLATKNELMDQVAILLGGRVAEEIVFGSVAERVIKMSPTPVLSVNPYRVPSFEKEKGLS
jgi:cell division protease FtsH